MSLQRVALLSLEPWDEVWRRNQHLVHGMLAAGLVAHIDFYEPPTWRGSRANRPVPWQPQPGVTVIPLSLILPKRAFGLQHLGRTLRLGTLRAADALWINDAALGIHCARPGQRLLYDVTDDWRTYDFPDRIIGRITHAEDVLARRATTVVCSPVLQELWRERYGVAAHVINNGVDVRSHEVARPHLFAGPGPHVGYVGTLQAERLDLSLIQGLAADPRVGTLHLIGPDALDRTAKQLLAATPGVVLHPPVASRDVASWMLGLDVLLSPHRITPFTMSLDAIKAYEYLASGRPIVATPTSGFQHLSQQPAVHIVDAEDFNEAVLQAQLLPRVTRDLSGFDWSSRSSAFARALAGARVAL